MILDVGKLEEEHRVGGEGGCAGDNLPETDFRIFNTKRIGKR